MGYNIYLPTRVQLENPLSDEVLTYSVTYEAVRSVLSMEDAIEIATSLLRGKFGDHLPKIETEYGAKGTLTAVELFHDFYRPVKLPNGVQPAFAPAAVIRSDKNKDIYERRFAFVNPPKQPTVVVNRYFG